MKKKHKIILLVVGIFLTISLMIGLSYAYYIFSVSQSGTNVVRSDCFEITYSDGNAINLTDTIPLTDEEARELEPYTFTINNICNSVMDYSVNIETLNTSTIDLNSIAAKLDEKNKQVLGTLDNNTNIVNSNALSSKTIFSDYLKAGESKTHNLRLWVDVNATIDQSASKSYYFKVVVTGTLKHDYNEAILMKGQNFNVALKTLSGDLNPKMYSSNTSITSLKKSMTAPIESDNAILVSDDNSQKPIYAWFKDGTIYFYSDADDIYMNEDSSSLLRGFDGISSLNLNFFDTTKVTNMSSIFQEMHNLVDLDINNFNTSNVTDMGGMFGSLSSLENLDVSNLNTSKVTNMSGMFLQDSSLTGLDVSSFNTSKVTDMSYMFSQMQDLTSLDVSNFDTSNVTYMDGMFYDMDSLTSLDVSNFDTSNVISMASMFSSMSSITSLDVSNFDTSSVKNMSNMFGIGMLWTEESLLTNIYGLDKFDTSNVTNMSNMFYGLKRITSLNLSNFNTSNVKNMSGMFKYMSGLTNLDISSFDTTNVTDMSEIFRAVKKLTNIDLSHFNTSKVTNMSQMFEDMTKITSLNLSNFDTSNVTDMSNMFSSMNGITSLDISNFDTSNVTNMSRMFNVLRNATTIYVGANWNTDKVRDSSNMFYFSKKIVGGAGTTYDSNHEDKEYARVDDPTNGKPGYFTLKTT